MIPKLPWFDLVSPRAVAVQTQVPSNTASKIRHGINNYTHAHKASRVASGAIVVYLGLNSF